MDESRVGSAGAWVSDHSPHALSVHHESVPSNGELDLDMKDEDEQAQLPRKKEDTY
jgi:hypothetical protein